ncbi:hypothetical protein KKH30_04490, partial [Candidatus Micrarchaeota archaeon]|nr:hypothetical protein [Candidatus Micrarchaeota archaeon]MBU1939997.1 hypothetical protein [Candidatus Micrarchaeota archaeon]
MSVAKSTRERIALFVVLGLAFILLHNSASAALIEETAFSGLGYGDFKVVDADNGKCAEYVFLQARDLNYAEYALLSLHAEFGEGNAILSVYLNNEEDSLADLDAKEFKAGIARVHLPWEMLREKNTLRICVNSEGGTANARVLSDSGIGYYTMPDFSMRG